MKPSATTLSQQAKTMLTEQLKSWELARLNYAALENVQTRRIDIDGYTIRIQFNPARITSSGAKLDAKSIRERTCFLCPINLPPEQIRLPFGENYYILSNPYPIFPEHFTVSSRTHVDQEIVSRFGDLLDLARQLSDYTVFYNGPRSGASAPDHAHFQAASRNIMPIDTEWEKQIEKSDKVITGSPHGELLTLTHYLRNGFLIRADQTEIACSLFQRIYQALPRKEDETEPAMNIFAWYNEKEWVVVIIPRRQHRPRQFSAEGEERIVTSPGAADIGGLFITPREEDFHKLTEATLRDIFAQVCFTDEEIDQLGKSMRN